MPAPMKNYRLIRYVKADGSYDAEEDICYIGRDRVPQARFFYPGAKITYICDDHPDREMKPDATGRPTCEVCGRQPEG